MNTFLLIVVMTFNLFISWMNARACGYTWEQSKRAGGWGRVVVWSAAIQSGIGFTMAYYLVIVMAAMATNRYPPALAKYSADIFIIGVSVPLLGSGLILMIESWKRFMAEQSFGNGAVALWNTGAQMSNTVQIGKGLWDAVDDLFSAKNKNAQGQLIVLALLLVVIAALLGAITTVCLIKHYMREYQANELGRASS